MLLQYFKPGVLRNPTLPSSRTREWEWAQTGLIGPMQGAIPTQSHNPSREVGHTTGVYVAYSFRTLVWVLLRVPHMNRSVKVRFFVLIQED